jgi:GNAT superfamily N-acetyltransferase
MNNLTIRHAESFDLKPLNRVIESAVLNWPLAPRVKRLSVPPLQYDGVDLDSLEIFVALFEDEIAGVAAWDPEAACELPIGHGGLFHGLYVLPVLQRLGIGQALMDRVYESAQARQVPGLLFKTQRVARSFFEHNNLAFMPEEENAYPWRYWKSLA